MTQQVLDFVQNLFGWMNYAAIISLMAVEASLFPFPSEVVMVPAGYLASIGKLNIFIVVLCWIIGSLIGSIFNYFIGYYIWAWFIKKYGKYFFIKEEDYIKSEELFRKNDVLYTFVWRLIPAVRQLISIPAWIFKMNLPIFLAVTALWAWLWCTILTLVGYYLWEWTMKIIWEYSNEIWIIALVLIAIFIYLKIFRKKKS